MRNFDDNELRRRVDEVLYYIWDPIGVSESPFARGEYENYVPKVLQLVTDNDDIGPISAYLAEIMKTSMELKPNMEKCNRTAEILLEHKSAIKQGCA